MMKEPIPWGADHISENIGVSVTFLILHPNWCHELSAPSRDPPILTNE
jgi:hypothetical protein